MFLLRVLVLACCLIFWILAPVCAQEVRAVDTKGLYGLPVGAQVEFETSASASLPGRDGGLVPASGTIISSFTVLRVDGGIRTMLASVQTSGLQTDDVSSPSSPARHTFTFEITADGEIGRFAGRFGAPFPGWSPEILFPMIPETSGSKITLPLPPLNASFTTTASRETQDGAVVVTARVADAQPAFGGQLTVKDYQWQCEYEPSASTLRSSRLGVDMSVPGPENKELEMTLAYETRRVSQRLLQPATIAALQSDAAAGIAVINQLQSGRGGPGDTDAVKAIEAYLEKHPSGEFAPLFGNLLSELKTQEELQKNFAKLQPGSPVPDFQATSIDGEPVRLADYRGKVVLLDFWASWCPPCVASMPKLKRLHEQFSEKGFEIIGISADHDEQVLRRFVERMDLPWKQVWVPEPTPGTVMHQYGITKFPTLVLIGRDGIIRGVDLDGEELEKVISSLLE